MQEMVIVLGGKASGACNICNGMVRNGYRVAKFITTCSKKGVESLMAYEAVSSKTFDEMLSFGEIVEIERQECSGDCGKFRVALYMKDILDKKTVIAMLAEPARELKAAYREVVLLFSRNLSRDREKLLLSECTDARERRYWEREYIKCLGVESDCSINYWQTPIEEAVCNAIVACKRAACGNYKSYRAGEVHNIPDENGAVDIVDCSEKYGVCSKHSEFNCVTCEE